MTIATGSRSQIAYVTETVWGTTPTTPALVEIPYTSFGLNFNKTIHDDDSIQADRMTRHTIHGNKSVAGAIGVNYSATDFDPFLESVFNNTWSTNVLKTGSTTKSFTIEQGSLDINQYSVFTGVQVSSMTIDVPVNGIVTATFNVVGKGASLSGTALDASVTNATASRPFFHAGGVFKEGGVTVGFITGINLTVDNGVGTNYALGTTDAYGLNLGLSRVTGTVTAYFENGTMVNKFINGTLSNLEFTLTDGTHTHKYTMNGVTYTGATKNISGNGPVLLTMPFVANYNSLDANNLVLTRSA